MMLSISSTGKFFCLLARLMIVYALIQVPARAGDFMLMPTISFAKESRQVDDIGLQKQQLISDLFYTTEVGRFRFLGEVQVDKGGYDTERLQVGWRVTPEHFVWLGRFHNPIGHWNTEHHHGHYMETTAERPRILEFEDEGGPLPIHLVGMLLEGAHSGESASWQYDLGVASGPRIDEGLEPVDVIRDPRLNKLALVARVAFRPDATRDDQYGVFAARTKIPVAGLEFTEVVQNIGGVYVNQELQRWRLFSELFRITNSLSPNVQTAWPSYWAGFAQLEYKLVPAEWTAFGRYEGISSRLSDDYLATFPQLLRERDIVGVRWDFYQNQALKLEFNRDLRFDGSTSKGIELQWSGMFQW
jgi:hypothetical protein